MKILMLCDYFDENMENQETILSRYYLKYKYLVTIIAPNLDFKPIKSRSVPSNCIYYRDGLKIIRRSQIINIKNKIKFSKRLYKDIKDELPDLIFIHGVQLSIPLVLFYKKKHSNCKIIFDFHGDYSNSAKSWFSKFFYHKLFLRIILKFAYNKFDRIFYITPNSGLFLNELYKIPYSRMELLPLGCDTDLINRFKENQGYIKIREYFGVKQNEFVIFTGGKLSEEKRTDLLVDVLLFGKYDSLHLFIVGDFPNYVEKKYKTDLITKIKMNPRIHFIGWVSGLEVYDYMIASDIAVFPSSQSVLWQQSMGVGLPIIIGETEDQEVAYLNKNNCISIIPKESISKETLLQSIEILMNNTNQFLTIKKNTKQTVEEYLSYHKIMKKTLECLD